jgi:hypothetical protein
MKDVRDATAAILDGTTLSSINARTQAPDGSPRLQRQVIRTMVALLVSLSMSTAAVRAKDGAGAAPAASAPTSAYQDSEKPGVTVTTTWSEGFTLETPGGDNRLQFGTLVQVDGRFDLQDASHSVTDTFVLRRVRPIIQGRVARFFDFRLVPDFGNGAVALFDASFDTRFSTAARIRVGKDETPVGYEQPLPDFALLFTERALATNLVPNRDIGVQLLGEVAGRTVSYAAGILNGVPDAANGDVDVNDGKDLVGRVAVRPFQRVSAPALLQHAGFAIAGSEGSQSGTLPIFRTSGQQVIYSYAAAVVADGRRTRVSPAAFIYKQFEGFGEYVWSSQRVRNASRADSLTNEALRGHSLGCAHRRIRIRSRSVTTAAIRSRPRTLGRVAGGRTLQQPGGRSRRLCVGVRGRHGEPARDCRRRRRELVPHLLREVHARLRAHGDDRWRPGPH